MYVLSLTESERAYLLRLLGESRGTLSRIIGGKLRSADDVFGLVSWTNEDIISLLKEHEVDTSIESVKRIRDSYYARHIDDRMVESGWEVLEDAIAELAV